MSDAADSTQSTTKRKAGRKANSGGPGNRGAQATIVAPTLDEETATALTLYNTYLVADREQQAHERALRKAEKAKDDAAAAVRELNDRKAPASESAAAETKYREAVEALRRLRDGDTEAPRDQDDLAGDDAEAVPDDATATEETPDTTDEAPDTTEDSADEAPDTTEDSADEAPDTTEDSADESSSVGVEASVGDDDLAGDEPAGVAG